MKTAKIDASRIVGTGFPPNEGKRLADALVSRTDVDWERLEIDVSALAAVLLISAFFNGFLQTVYERRASLLDKARKIHWHVQFPFQGQNIEHWMSNFVPQGPRASA